ncbi:fungal-specific transcription factor domain-domain-containing protein [Clohesyomyces aquaticus]|uniref:Fungal-specific transcription factor domain-domain-containing protein n=1 Tax=Clohesyomyces aquaticus TaxID=1231657 RepID=A0A1Y1Z8Z4_9PLEO|nr:fungal-specific transcription factor domain-domain-containing protein [Clohesyomyces aquaticus]
MPSGSPESPDESYFNDLSQQPPETNSSGQSPTRSNSIDGQKDDGRKEPKRIACVLCRKRKLKCDGCRPTCGTCKRLSHDCAYDEVRKKSGPKRGYVKLLEARLQQVEHLLKNQETNDQSKEIRPDAASAYVANTISQGPPDASAASGFLGASGDAAVNFPESISPGPDAFQTNSSNMNSAEGEFPWEMIGLGLDEPLPPQDVINDLYTIYFTKIHPSLPIIHRPRFLAAMNLAPHMRPPVCLRYIMWTLAASVTDKYDALQEHFYHRARKYAQMDEMKGHGESTITLGHCQTWILTATYEFKQMYFPRAWLSSGRGVRLAQMMQLHRLDGAGLDVKQCLPPPKDWTEREERRRTFWMAFCVDRYASIGTGWPMTIDERDIMTNMPASEEAFDKSKPMPTGTLQQAMEPQGAAQLQAFGGIVLTATLFGRNLLHLHRPEADDRDDDINGGFWIRHRGLESVLLNASLALPDYLRLPSGLPDPNVVFLNMCIHTSAICLHQAAIFKADKYRLPVTVSNESKIRCVTAAAEIASVMRMISHMDLSAMNPFISFCVYVAARVFVQYLKTRPNDQQMNSSLQFLLQAMQALRRKNPLTESFLVQLDLDLESAGVPGIDRRPLMHPDPKATVSNPLQESK